MLTVVLLSVTNNMPTVLIGALAIDASSVQGAVREAMIYANVTGCELGLKWLHLLAIERIKISWSYYFGIELTLPVLFITLSALALRLS